MRILAGTGELCVCAQAPVLMGILNIGDDSVADQLHLPLPAEQQQRAQQLIAEGAQVIDIGVQSGRTDTSPISATEEIERLSPLVSELSRQGVLISIDTYRASVAEAALRAGAHIINDVGGMSDPEIAEVAASFRAALVLMHTRAAPKTAAFPGYEDPVAEVASHLEAMMQAAIDAGVDEGQLILDPGLDYAKTPSESILVLRGLSELHALGRPLLLAVSRKYFIGMLTGRAPLQRLAGTLAAVSFGLDAGAQILRVHDVAAVRDLLTVRAALEGEHEPEMKGDPEAEALKWLPPKQPSHSPH
jgi:dihydropteroate synthase